MAKYLEISIRRPDAPGPHVLFLAPPRGLPDGSAEVSFWLRFREKGGPAEKRLVGIRATVDSYKTPRTMKRETFGLQVGDTIEVRIKTGDLGDSLLSADGVGDSNET